MFGFTGCMPTPRGSYAKGLAKREEILTQALETIARSGFRGASVKEIADAVGLSQAGLLHYFDSKEELFTEILRKRDEIDSDGRPFDIDGEPEFDKLIEGYLQVVRHNSEVPGLVELFSQLAVDAADQAHPAHEFFRERGAHLRGMLARTMRSAQRTGRIDPRLDPDTLARTVQALTDGMQLQWLADPEVDMTAPLVTLFEVIGASAPARPEPEG